MSDFVTVETIGETKLGEAPSFYKSPANNFIRDRVQGGQIRGGFIQLKEIKDFTLEIPAPDMATWGIITETIEFTKSYKQEPIVVIAIKSGSYFSELPFNSADAIVENADTTRTAFSVTGYSSTAGATIDSRAFIYEIL